MKLMKKKKGFTLIELMAVVAILAILAAVLVPTVTGYINRSKKSAIIIQARAAVNAIESYNVTLDDSKKVSEDSTSTINDLINAEENEAVEAIFKDGDLLTKDDVDLILNATVEVVYKINKTEKDEALNKIEINDGKLVGYGGESLVKSE